MQYDLTGKLNQCDWDRGWILASYENRSAFMPHLADNGDETIHKIGTINIFVRLVENDEFVEFLPLVFRVGEYLQQDDEKP